MQIRLPEIYKDAREVLEKGLERGTFLKGLYGTVKINPCTIAHYQIHDKKDTYEVGTITVDMTYTERVLNKYGKFEDKKVVQTLDILTPRGDKIWPYNMVVKVWDGKYPSAIAVDKKRELLYLVNLSTSTLEIVEFAHLTKEQMEAITEDLNEKEPYKVRIDEETMFDVIAELEGFRALNKGVYFELDCGVRFKVYNNTSKE